MLPLHLLVANLVGTIAVTGAPGASDCPDTANLTARVERIIGEAAAADDGVRTVVAADFSRDHGVYEAKIRLSGKREGERTLRDPGPTCEALADAVAVAIALLFDPASRPSARAPEVKAAPSDATSRWGVWLAGRFGAGAGLVGGASWMAGGALQASLGPLTLVHLGGALSGSRESKLGAGAVDVGLWFVEAGAFHSLSGERFKVGPAVSFMAGALRGSGGGYPITSTAALPWIAFGAGARGDIGVLPKLRLGARVMAVMPTRQHSFSVGYVGSAYESSQIAGIADLVVDVRVW